MARNVAVSVFRAVQDRRLEETSAVVGRVQEMSSDELRQTVTVDSSVLQVRNHSENIGKTKTHL